MEMGLIVFVLIIYFAIEIIKIINEGVKEIKLEYLLPHVVSIFLLGDIGNPIPFIAIAILLREKFRIEKKTLY